MKRTAPKTILLLCVLMLGLSCDVPSERLERPQTDDALPTQGVNTVSAAPIAGFNEVLTTQAWEAYNRRDYKTAIESADKCINEFLGRAMRVQEELEAKKVPLPSIGAVSNQEKQVIFARGLLNDVATCLYIKGRSLEAEGQREEAVKVYKATTKYTYARCWDTQGWFWSPSEGALDRLRMLR